MVNSNQYPHTLQVMDGTGAWQDHAICRDQPNSKGVAMPVGDGTFFAFSSLVFMPLGSAPLLTGQDFRVIEADGKVRLKTEVKRFSVDLLHCRLWA